MNAIIVSAILGVVMMFSGMFTKHKSTITLTAIAALFILLGANLLNSYGIFSIQVNTHELLYFNKLGLYFNTILIAATLIFVLLSGREIENVGINTAEYYALIFFVLCGTTILTSFNGLLMLFLGIEIMSIPLYILTGAEKRNLKSNEASLKYFLMGAFSTGIMLMGIALLYGATGSFALSGQSVLPPSVGIPGASFLQAGGLILLFVSMCFKVSAAPFHFWTPDVYDGAPTVFTSFMATIVKAAGFFAFIKVFDANAALLGPSWKILLSIVIIATLFVGNITAVFQRSIKRMLAYSSIAQAGFMLFALYSYNDMAYQGILLYTVAYCLATIGFFAVLMKVKDYTFDGLNGLAAASPVLAFAATVFLLSLAGIPLTAGFFAKYYMLASVVKAGGALWIVIAAVLFAAVSVYYYFKVIQSMYFKEGQPELNEISTGFKVGVLLLAAGIITIGVLPSIVLNWLYF
ncbi:MAG: NADH-quinone oxidoreductase subunit N [Sphingobacteriia bacterium]|nr:MAG: NADH-quinone oxidoreductase subunit N [Sphingobacteriia bacterium]TAG29860.1 MAG: NADH-quinone oxidoreductase subunit N [Sphingobacteriia bacterium]